jgi:N-acetylglucosaminyl-diphospho-decaprenol L-rhamnosyltransferase
MKSVCLAILNYNGKKHLEQLLPTACTAAKNLSDNCAVVVLDNHSTDDDVAWVAREFPSVEAIVSPQNDYLFSYNWLAKNRTEDVLVLLNNDLKVDHDFLDPLLRHFQSPDIFSVSARSYDWNGAQITSGPARLKFKNGFYSWKFDTQQQKTCHTLFTSGGFMAVDRKKFIELGGFNRLFYPAYCEDVDLCFRAWRCGWRCIYEPASVVWHREQSSWSATQNSSASQLTLKHSLFFQWTSLPMERGRIQRWWSIAKIVFGGAMRGNNLWLRVYPNAVREWTKIRGHFSSLKTSREELAAITRAMESPLCPN